MEAEVLPDGHITIKISTGAALLSATPLCWVPKPQQATLFRRGPHLSRSSAVQLRLLLSSPSSARSFAGGAHRLHACYDALHKCKPRFRTAKTEGCQAQAAVYQCTHKFLGHAANKQSCPGQHTRAARWGTQLGHAPVPDTPPRNASPALGLAADSEAGRSLALPFSAFLSSLCN